MSSSLSNTMTTTNRNFNETSRSTKFFSSTEIIYSTSTISITSRSSRRTVTDKGARETLPAGPSLAERPTAIPTSIVRNRTASIPTPRVTMSSSVTLPRKPSNTVPSTAFVAIMGGALGGALLTAIIIVLIIVLAVVCICQRNKKQRKLAQEIYSSSENPYMVSSTYTIVEPVAYETPVPSLSHSSQTTGSSPPIVPQLYEEPVRSIPEDISASTGGEYELVTVNRNAADEQYSTVGDDSNHYTACGGDSEGQLYTQAPLQNGENDHVYFTLDKGQDERQQRMANKKQQDGAAHSKTKTADKDHLYFTIEKRELIV